ncbi:MAG: winged helix domain-containing protein, partial [Thermomonas haemolytica]
CLLRHPWSRMAWRRGTDGHARLYAGGGMHLLDAGDARRLAAAGRIDAEAYAGLSGPGRAALLALVGAGHYQLEQEDAE